MDNKTKHLAFIQGVVNRLSTNSFLLKGWSVLLVSALFALAASDARIYFVYLAYFPAFAFWSLDGYFLWQERLYRALYDHVRGLKDDEAVDFSMDTSLVIEQTASWFQICFSKTLAIFHGTVTGTIILVMVLSLVFMQPPGA
jgi:hypothetical protein